MSAFRTVYVRCEFTRGGFAHERIFSIPAPDRGGVYRGVAYIAYCHRLDQTQLPEEEPPAGQKMTGLVAARVIEEKEDGRLTVQVPDGELCDIEASIVEGPTHVPVGS